MPTFDTSRRTHSGLTGRSSLGSHRTDSGPYHVNCYMGHDTSPFVVCVEYSHPSRLSHPIFLYNFPIQLDTKAWRFGNVRPPIAEHDARLHEVLG